MILYFPGEKLCERVKDSLRDHYKKLGIPFEDDDESSLPGTSKPVKSSKSKASSKRVDSVHGTETETSSQVSKVSKKSSKPRSYVPQPRSGAFAILVALIRAENDGITKLTKAQIIQDAQEFCDESMTKPKNGSHFTAYSSMKTLIKKELVSEERHRFSQFSLTEEGKLLAERLFKYANGGLNNAVNVDLSSEESNQASQTQMSSQSSIKEFQMTNFDIVLLVDTRESTSGVDSNIKKTALMANLTQQLNVPVEMRALPAGDFAWIAREKIGKVNSSQDKRSSEDRNEFVPSTSQSSPMQRHFASTKNVKISSSKQRRELMLDYVVERKRVDDLVGSIVDGRFHEQKHRLKASGIRKPIYLVESLTKGEYLVAFRNLLQAVHNSQVIDGFNVKYTKDHSETIMYLVIMTKMLIRKYKSKTLTSCPREDLADKDDTFLMMYTEFEAGSKKMTNFTASEMFLKQLLTFSGMSLVKAKSIVEKFPTIGSLIEAYKKCQEEEGKKALKERINLIATIKDKSNDRSIGPVLGKKLMLTYCRDCDKFL